MLDLGISINAWPWVWLAVAVAIVLVELTVLGGSLMILPFGVSALVAALLGFSDVGLDIQWGVFAGGGGVLFLVFWRYQALVQRGNTLPPGVGAVRLVGLTGIVTRDVDPEDATAHGRVSVAGEDWLALTGADDVLRAGTHVRITDVEGTRVRVEPLDPTDQGPT